jgi:hypothetical protein
MRAPTGSRPARMAGHLRTVSVEVVAGDLDVVGGRSSSSERQMLAAASPLGVDGLCQSKAGGVVVEQGLVEVGVARDERLLTSSASTAKAQEVPHAGPDWLAPGERRRPSYRLGRGCSR